MRECPDLNKELGRRATERKKKGLPANIEIDMSGSSEEFLETDSQDEEGNHEVVEANLATAQYSKKIGTWYVDSGASKHVTGDSRLLTNVTPHNRKSAIEIANGQSYPISGSGELAHNEEIKFDKVLYVLGVTRNLLSVEKITNQQLGVYFDSNRFLIIKPPNTSTFSVVATGERLQRNGLYKLT